MARVSRCRNVRIAPNNHLETAIIDIKLRQLFIDIEGTNHREYPKIAGYLKSVNKPLIEEYIKNTIGPSHPFTLNFVEAFEIDHPEDIVRYRSELHNKRLLWHGTRKPNLYKMIRDGFDLSCARVGTMFDKGLYFSDCVTKSANYTSVHPVYSQGVSEGNKDYRYLFLCEVALGNSKTFSNADYNAKSKLGPNMNSTHGHGSYNCIDEGSQFEDDVLVCPGLLLFNERKTLEYNEFVVYNTNQVRFRYLVKVEFVRRQAPVPSMYTRMPPQMPPPFLASQMFAQPLPQPPPQNQMAASLQQFVSVMVPTTYKMAVPNQITSFNQQFSSVMGSSSYQPTPPNNLQFAPSNTQYSQYTIQMVPQFNPINSSSVQYVPQNSTNNTYQMQQTSSNFMRQPAYQSNQFQNPNFNVQSSSNVQSNQFQNPTSSNVQSSSNVQLNQFQNPTSSSVQSSNNSQSIDPNNEKKRLESKRDYLRSVLSDLQKPVFNGQVSIPPRYLQSTPAIIKIVQSQLDDIEAKLQNLPSTISIQQPTTSSSNQNINQLPSIPTSNRLKRPLPIVGLKIQDSVKRAKTDLATLNSTSSSSNLTSSSSNLATSTSISQQTIRTMSNNYLAPPIPTSNQFQVNSTTQNYPNPYYNPGFNAYIPQTQQPYPTYQKTGQLPNTITQQLQPNSSTQSANNPVVQPQRQSISQILANLPSVYCQYFSSFAPPYINPLKLTAGKNSQTLPQHLCAYCNTYHP